MAGRIIDSFMEWVTIYSSWIEGENRMARYPVTTSRWKPQFWRVWGWRPSYRNPVRSRKDRLPFRSCTYGGTLLYQSQGAQVARKKKKSHASTSLPALWPSPRTSPWPTGGQETLYTGVSIQRHSRARKAEWEGTSEGMKVIPGALK